MHSSGMFITTGASPSPQRGSPMLWANWATSTAAPEALGRLGDRELEDLDRHQRVGLVSLQVLDAVLLVRVLVGVNLYGSRAHVRSASERAAGNLCEGTKAAAAAAAASQALWTASAARSAASLLHQKSSFRLRPIFSSFALRMHTHKRTVSLRAFYYYRIREHAHRFDRSRLSRISRCERCHEAGPNMSTWSKKVLDMAVVALELLHHEAVCGGRKV